MVKLVAVLVLAVLAAGCGMLVPYCDTEVGCSRSADGTWRCPPPGGMVCVDGEVHSTCVDHGGDYCRVSY